MAKYAIAVFVSAFLLFQIQPIIAKYILPWFGGVSTVWTICLVFFQVVLLLGYLYAHLISKLESVQRQAIVHAVLVAIAVLFFLPIRPSLDFAPESGSDPSIAIIKLLIFTVGLPYALISSSGPLLQSWFQKSYPKSETYRLYALSNVGSLLGLITYPFLIEPFLTLDQQTSIWSWGFIGYFVLCAACAVSLSKSLVVVKVEGLGGLAKSGAPVFAHVLLWAALSATASVLLLATTNQLTQDIASVPFLWLLPLSLYLITFIICFDRPQWYRRAIWVPLLLLSGFASSMALLQGSEASFMLQVFGYTSILFVGCMVCHGELYLKRPSAEYLTKFYLTISFGGAVGGLAVAILAPHVFSGYWELHIGWVSLFVLTGLCLAGSVNIRSRVLDLGAQAGWILFCVFFSFLLYNDVENKSNGHLYKERGFFGVLTVTDFVTSKAESKAVEKVRVLKNGTIVHGTQLFKDEVGQLIPTSYYGKNSGVGIAIREYLQSNHNDVEVGVIGMGAATISSLCVGCRSLTFFEIDNYVIDVERKYFSNISLLEETGANVSVIAGDGRLKLAELADKGTPYQFDVLVVDAFSGDAIPVHLLTIEAFELYRRSISSDGIIAIHTSNRHMNLSPIVVRAASKIGLNLVKISSASDKDKIVYSSDWILITPSDRFSETRDLVGGKCRTEEIAEGALWTDQYSNILSVLGEGFPLMRGEKIIFTCFE
jgi:spermidine synthase